MSPDGFGRCLERLCIIWRRVPEHGVDGFGGVCHRLHAVLSLDNVARRGGLGGCYGDYRGENGYWKHKYG
ncbi:hypothetical protein GGD55_004968 [Rhizobium giardinii]|uniref:Uncharacterized protein n=1 Tax=Rhizobium giardinii TaxID=56731 RepID=A0A7W8XB08_9HYPH|nr:hypothetical protein [Rhizobium giardinii]